MSFQAEHSVVDAIQVLSLNGRLDSATSSQLEKSIQGIFQAPGTRLLMDFAKLDYISSAGLRVVLMAAKRAKNEQGRLILCSLQAHVKQVFEISGFLKILEVSDSRDTAISQLTA
ncbi:MAG: STAS domain-containing protein [Zoogloea sp.]|uniref:STAS domain-containing protein n=1 Tax=Zoogloea sp. TaxID=49181 RepID=UPI003F3A0599